MEGTYYKKKPVVIEAMLWDGTAEDATKIIDWALFHGQTMGYHCPEEGNPECVDLPGHSVWHYCPSCSYNDIPPYLTIPTLEGAMKATPNDFIIRGIYGEFYPCKPGIFAESYEAI